METQILTGVIVKIISIMIGIAALFAFSKTGDNSYTFEIGEILMVVTLVGIAALLLNKFISSKKEEED